MVCDVCICNHGRSEWDDTFDAVCSTLILEAHLQGLTLTLTMTLWGIHRWPAAKWTFEINPQFQRRQFIFLKSLLYGHYNLQIVLFRLFIIKAVPILNKHEIFVTGRFENQEIGRPH